MKKLRPTDFAVNLIGQWNGRGQGPCPGKNTADHNVPVLHSLSEGQRDKSRSPDSIE